MFAVHYNTACKRFVRVAGHFFQHRGAKLRSLKQWLFLLCSLPIVCATAIMTPQRIQAANLDDSTISGEKSYTISLNMQLRSSGNQILNSSGQAVALRGVSSQRYICSPYGDWQATGETWGQHDPDSYRQQAVIENLDAMKSWGCNVIRFHTAIQYWLENTNNFTANFKDMCSLARDRGFYVVIDLYSVRPYPNTKPYFGKECPLPYGQWTPEGPDRTLMPDRQAFINLWINMANAMKSLDNVIFEPYSEPHGIIGTETATRDEYFAMMQQLIPAIRATGAKQPILVQWGATPWYNLSTRHSSNSLSWVEDYPLNYQQDNLIVSIHAFPESCVTGAGNVVCADVYQNVVAWSKAILLDDVAKKYPVIVGSVGTTCSHNTPSVASLKNFLQRFNELGIGYINYCWMPDKLIPQGILQNGVWLAAPNEAGKVLINAIASGSAPAATAPVVANASDATNIAANLRHTQRQPDLGR